MEVYIFGKNKRCPYLNYGFYLDEVTQHPLNQLQFDCLATEHKVSKQFLEGWKKHLQNNQQSFNQSNNRHLKTIYNNAIFDIREILSILESGLDADPWEIYIEE
jgi:hypothetical protein